jgi:hypothetical protein
MGRISGRMISNELELLKAEALEYAAREGKIDFIEARHESFIKRIDNLIRDLRGLPEFPGARQPGARP